ncbi:hypothetical protein FHR99_000855 [Litorivivens lipolytica]|uniref:Uncharacterized protein n=1 Tax=Litorivivens lipolytica TaxID=1524264 RepID=A0A7W4W4A5_9GAMM|nr:hypothetical protein [Litorivivens lipolytica]MBB3046619.1 hypothetical protein [Litorivivens lipolytica]
MNNLLRFLAVQALAYIVLPANASFSSADAARQFLEPHRADCRLAGPNPRLQYCLTESKATIDRLRCLQAHGSAVVSGASVEQRDDRVKSAQDRFAAGGDLQQALLKQTLDRVKAVVSTSPLPALAGVADDFTNTLVPTLLEASGGLNEPQTLGLSVVLPRFLGLRVKLGGYSNPDAELNPLLEKTLLERGQLAGFREQEARLDLGDDYYLSADVSVLGRWLGRDPMDHGRDQSALAWQLMADAPPGQDALSRRFQEAATKIVADAAFSESDIAAVDCAVYQYRKESQQAQARIAQSGLNDFWRLVHNQPQLILGYRRLHRDDLVGADSRTYKIKLSSGLFNNVNFLRWTSRCDKHLGGDDCPQAMDDMLQSWAMRHGLGLALYFEESDLAILRVELPELASAGSALTPPLLQQQIVGDDDVFRLEGGNYQRFGWSVGTELIQMPSSDRESKSSLRLDAGMDYYRYDRDLLRADHDVSRVTLTYRRGLFSFPFHLMYRSETEFEADLGDDLVVGIGVQSSFSQF